MKKDLIWGSPLKGGSWYGDIIFEGSDALIGSTNMTDFDGI